MSGDLVEQLMALPRETVIEAARFVAAEVTGSIPEERVEQQGAWAADKPFAHLADVEILSRLVLISQGMSGTEGAARVTAAIAGSGRQNLVLGGLEIVLLAGLGVIALQIALTGGKLTDTAIRYGEDANGRPTVTVRTTERQLALSEPLAAVLKPLFTKAGGSADG